MLLGVIDREKNSHKSLKMMEIESPGVSPQPMMSQHLVTRVRQWQMRVVKGCYSIRMTSPYWGASKPSAPLSGDGETRQRSARAEASGGVSSEPRACIRSIDTAPLSFYRTTGCALMYGCRGKPRRTCPICVIGRGCFADKLTLNSPSVGRKTVQAIEAVNDVDLKGRPR